MATMLDYFIDSTSDLRRALRSLSGLSMATMIDSFIDRTRDLRCALRSLAGPSDKTRGCSKIVGSLDDLLSQMSWIQARIPDAEQGEVADEAVRLWLEELKLLAYDAEDVVEEIDYEVLRYREYEGRDHVPVAHDLAIAGTKRRREGGDDLVSPPCPSLIDPSYQDQMVAKIRETTDRLDEVCGDMGALRLGAGVGERTLASPLGRDKTRASCLAGEQAVHGREDDRRKVIEMLLSDDGGGRGDKKARVVSIVGVGGVGKTTLAQLVFNDGRVAAHFDTRLWVSVSGYPFDEITLTRSILKQLLGRSFERQEFSCLQQILREELDKKMFLLVLDDVRTESKGCWDALWVSLLGGAKGSRVLLTTRNEWVSRALPTAGMYYLGRLSDRDSWSLFEQYAFAGRSSNEYPDLVLMGQEIVRRCQGLPLSVKLLSGLLFCEFTEDKWKDILSSELWGLPEGGDHIVPALKLSYYHLPPCFKPCFTYCAVFPKDYKFEMDKLVYLWMAQGYIRPTASKSKEHVGRECFEDLLLRSFFQQSGDGQFQMHSIIHDLALSICGRECSRHPEDGSIFFASGRARHLWFEDTAADEEALLLSTVGFPQSLRSCYLIRNPWVFPIAVSALSLEIRIDEAFQSMKYLWALYLYGWEVSRLPDSLGNLKHLHYLSIRRMVGLTRLPETLGNLLKLQTLEVVDAYDLEELPSSLKNLVNLRHLMVETPQYSYSLQMMPRGIGRLTQLQTLRRFVVGEGTCAAGIEELKALHNLQGELVINVRSLSNCVNVGGGGGGKREDATILKEKVGLKSLVLEFYDDWGTSGDQSCSGSLQQSEEFIEIIQPNMNIEELVIDGYMGSSFPKWMSDPSYLRLESIRLHSCRNCTHLPALGQLPSLKHLELRFMDELRSVGHEFLEDGKAFHSNQAYYFPVLKQLHFYCLPKCEGLLFGTQSTAAFPHLQLLQIEDCQKVRCIRLWHLTSLRELHVAGCDNLTNLELQLQAEHMHKLHTIRL